MWYPYIPQNFKSYESPMVGCHVIPGRRHFKWLLSWFSRTAHTNIWLSGCPLGPRGWFDGGDSLLFLQRIPGDSKAIELEGATLWVPFSFAVMLEKNSTPSSAHGALGSRTADFGKDPSYFFRHKIIYLCCM